MRDRRQDGQGDHLLAVVEDAVELAVDEFLGAELRDQEEVEGPRVALAGEGGDALGVDQDQAEDRQTDGDQHQARPSGFSIPGPRWKNRPMPRANSRM